MYAKRIQIINYGPINRLDIDFPFHQGVPVPVVLVGENGSGKSIVLSHIVNGLAAAKGIAYPGTPEVEPDKVFKLRSPQYIRDPAQWSYAKVDYEQELFMGELTALRRKEEQDRPYEDFPSEEVKNAWDQMSPDRNTHLLTNLNLGKIAEIKDLLGKSCTLYFPHNRFEEPAWLNEANLKSKATYTNLTKVQGATSRTLINYAPLKENQNWFFDVAYDMSVFDIHTQDIILANIDQQQSTTVRELKGFRGPSTTIYEIVLDIIRQITRGNANTTLKIGDRLNRTVSLWIRNTLKVPSILQLSSGETSLLNLFITVLRDFNLSGAPFSSAIDIRGIVIVDEVDLHLHAIHQYEVLPRLIKMFPNVQFIVTSHSPLFVLGMSAVFGERGFVLYRVPDGHQMDPEEFSEFGTAYNIFSSTRKFSDDIRSSVKNAQRPVLYVEGQTDINYLRKAAKLLGHEDFVDRVHLLDGEGDRLKAVWKAVIALPEQLAPKSVVVLFDCDYAGESQDKGLRFKRKIPLQKSHPINKGIENLFDKSILQKARNSKPALIDVAEAHKFTVRGQTVQIPEEWTVNENEKTNLCRWICENGTVEDFRHFEVIFDLLRQIPWEVDGN